MRHLFIINPKSGKGNRPNEIAEEIHALMQSRPDSYDIRVTERAGHGRELAAAAAQSSEEPLRIYAFGGDGTLNETVTGLAKSHTNVPVGYIPCGTTNDFSASHGLPKDIPGAMQGIVSGQRQRYDACCFADQYFVGVALFGAFSWMAYTTDQTKKNKLGYHAYVLDGMRDLSRLKPIHMYLEADGETLEDDYLFGAVSNAYNLGGYLDLSATGVDLSDGILELVLVKAPHSLPELDQLLRAITAGDFTGPWLTLRHVKNMKVHNPPELQWSLDGEKSGCYESVEIHALPGFLELQGGK